MTTVKLAKSFILKPKEKARIIIGCLTYASARLYNIANYERRNWSIESDEEYPSWYKQKKELKDNFWYKNLPSQTAQDTLKRLSKDWKSFYKLMKQYKQGELEDKPSPPHYKPKNSHFNIRYLNNGFKIVDGKLRLSIPRQLRSYLKEEYSIKSKFLWVEIPNFLSLDGLQIKTIEIKHTLDNFKVIIVVSLPDVEMVEDDNKYLSIDIGVNNLLTCYDNFNQKSFIISGRQWLSINRYFNKEIKHYQSILNGQGEKVSRRIKLLCRKRERQINHLLHSATRIVVDYCVENDISKVIVGDLKNIREDANLGKRVNQNFHKLPFDKIYHQLEYKLLMFGIACEKQEESYTSQCSPHSVEVCEENAEDSNRKKRGLYVEDGKIYNADSVGAFNIMRKYLSKIGSELKLQVKGLSNPKTFKWIDNKFQVSV